MLNTRLLRNTLHYHMNLWYHQLNNTRLVFNLVFQSPLREWRPEVHRTIRMFQYILWVHSLRWRHISVMVSHINDNLIVCSTTCSGWQRRKHQSSISMAIYEGIHRLSPYVGLEMLKAFTCHDFIMYFLWNTIAAIQCSSLCNKNIPTRALYRFLYRYFGRQQWEIWEISR